MTTPAPPRTRLAAAFVKRKGARCAAARVSWSGPACATIEGSRLSDTPERVLGQLVVERCGRDAARERLLRIRELLIDQALEPRQGRCAHEAASVHEERGRLGHAEHPAEDAVGRDVALKLVR